MKTAEEYKLEMLESPAYRLGTAIAIIEALLRGPEVMMGAWHRRAAEFLKDEEARAAALSGKGSPC